MRAAAASPEAEPLRPPRGSYLAVCATLVLLLLFMGTSALFHDPLQILPLAIMLLPSVVIDAWYRYLRAFRPNAVPIALFDAGPDLYNRLLSLRTTMGALTFGIFLGGFTLGVHLAAMPRLSAFPILLYAAATSWITLHTYIKTRNGLRTR